MLRLRLPILLLLVLLPELAQTQDTTAEIVFVSREQEQSTSIPGIYRVNSQTEDVQLIITIDEFASRFDVKQLNGWSFFLSENNHVAIGQEGNEILLVNLSDYSTTSYTLPLQERRQPIGGIDFLPNGKFLAHISMGGKQTPDGLPKGDQIHVLDLESNIDNVIMHVDDLEIASEQEVLSLSGLSWSPDGRYIAFDVFRTPTADATLPPSEPFTVFLVELETGITQRLAPKFVFAGWSRWQNESEVLYVCGLGFPSDAICKTNIQSDQTDIVISAPFLNTESQGIASFDVDVNGNIVFASGNGRLFIGTSDDDIREITTVSGLLVHQPTWQQVEP